ncbi:MAG TPA: helix-turn-helix domain-containing protein [Kofleriaceae bacterium]|nr:helix-turn-helix domain-containing protein [Kofleriaceae bacterium]
MPRRRRRAEPEPPVRRPLTGSLSIRSQILMGAAEVFGAHGYARTSVEDVLRAAGISRRTFYRFFRNKEELFDELADTAGMLFLQSIRNAATLGKTPEDKLANCVEVYLRAPQTAGPIFHVLRIEASRPGSRQAARRQVIIDALVGMISEGLRGEGRTVDPLVLRGLMGAMEDISMHVFDQHPGDETAIAHAKAAMLHIMTSTLAAPGP